MSIHDKDSPLDIANELNSYFADIGKNLADNIRPSALELDFTPIHGVPLFTLQETTTSEAVFITFKVVYRHGGIYYEIECM